MSSFQLPSKDGRLPNDSLVRLLARIWALLAVRQRIALVFVTLGGTVSGLLVTLPSLLVGRIVDALGRRHGIPTGQILELVALGFLFAGLRAAVHIALHRVTPQTEVLFRRAQVAHALATRLGDRRYAAEVNSVISSGTNSTSMLIRSVFGSLLLALVQMGWAAALSFHENWIEALVMIGAVPVELSIVKLQLKTQRGIRVWIQRAKSHLDGQVTELLLGKTEVRSLNAIGPEVSRIGNAARRLAERECRHHAAMGFFDALKYVVEAGAGVAVVWTGVLLSAHRAISTGAIITLYLLYLQFAAPLRELHHLRDQTGEAETQVALMFASLDEPVDEIINRPRYTGALRVGQDFLVARGVEVHYEGIDRAVVKGVDLSVDAGRFIGICGPSGSGKSTLLLALGGLQPCRSGQIEIGGAPLGALDLETLADLVSYLPQRSYLLAASVGDNVRFGLDKPVSDDEVRIALERAAVLSEIDDLPKGIDTMLGEGGAGLSGGQRQRVAIARLLLRRPRIALLDEATSALDLRTEAAVMAELEQSGITLVAVAHRLSTLEPAERIYVLENGVMTEEGTFATLRAMGGTFTSLLNSSTLRRSPMISLVS